ncbi:FtsX-like permease family protein [Glaciecola sp. MF2-115]|uniref:FtsX-like permease family protein n=1 Tax=Glaciecola sp. MF2-115 TaxID=3384827 RepID=UPI0039A07633
MAKLLSKILGRIPIGWLQLSHNRTRMLAAIFGVAFANVLVFVQLGIIGAFDTSIRMTYQPFKADIIISASDANTLSDGSSISRRYMYQSLSNENIESATAVYVGLLSWNLPNGNAASMQVYGIPPESMPFIEPSLRDTMGQITLQNTMLLDSKTRGLDKKTLNEIVSSTQRIELNNIGLSLASTVVIGSGFGADGNIFVSDQTFLRLFPKQQGGTPSHILLNVKTKLKTADAIDSVVSQLRANLEADDIQIHSLEDRIKDDVNYQMTKRPVGVIFGFGVFIGVLVGVVIVYQVLSTDVADHLKEYATFKSMGYKNRFFYSVITEQAVLLGSIGFIPGFLFAMLIYKLMTIATGLPVGMDWSRMGIVLFGTIIACMISGFIATRRLKAADPAELF